ncbi:MAG TPA: DUF1003 domain-containing protein [Ktedonobacterales bacterium]|nr:DUF1003 domain-containing protein [Ktedonobacterales bacterium]
MFLSSKLHLAILREHKRRAVESGQPVVLNPNEVHEEFKARLGFNGKVATIMTGIYGSMYFVYFLVCFMAGWMLWQTIMGHKAFDPYPFLLLLFIGNLIQLVGGPIIQVGQNLSSAHSELRAEADYEVNKKSFADVEQMQNRLEKLELENRELLHWIKENAVIHVSEEARTLKGPQPELPAVDASAASPASETPNAE